MAIVSYADYAAYRNLPDSVTVEEQDRITEVLTKAQARIETYCGRVFEAATATRTYDATGPHIDGRMLLVDADLLSVTTLTNGDGSVIPSGDYVLRPNNGNPKYAIVLKASSSHYWTWADDPEQAISVAGSWGFDTSAPPDIEQAVLQLADWYRKLQSQQPSDIGAARRLPDGTIELPSRLPKDIADLCEPYVRRALGAVG